MTPRPNPRSLLWLRPRLSLAPLALGALLLGSACGEAGEGAGGLPILTIDECQEIGGTPLFDPKDERPIEQSCPDGLYFLGEFDEEFFGEDGGICCASAEPAES